MNPMEENSGRITPMPQDKFKSQWWEILNRLPGEGLKGESAPVNVLGTYAKASAYFTPWLDFWVTSKEKIKLSLRIQELIILRMAFLRKSDYVWGHHIIVAKEAHITKEEIEALKKDPENSNWTELEKAFLKTAEELLESSNIEQSTWDILKKHWTDTELMDFITIVTQYFFFTSINNACGVALEKGLKGLKD